MMTREKCMSWLALGFCLGGIALFATLETLRVLNNMYRKPCNSTPDKISNCTQADENPYISDSQVSGYTIGIMGSALCGVGLWAVKYSRHAASVNDSTRVPLVGLSQRSAASV